MLVDVKQTFPCAGDENRSGRELSATFVTVDGYATGSKGELVQDEKIIQLRHAPDWTDGHSSILTLTPFRDRPARHVPLPITAFPMNSS